jgi:hypothetical protein
MHALEASAVIATKDFHRDFGLGYKEVKERKRRWAWSTRGQKEKKKSYFGEPCRHPQEYKKKKGVLGEPCRHPQAGEEVGEPCRHPQVGEPCRHPGEKVTKEEYPKGKVLDLMNLDKMKMTGGKTLEVNSFDEKQKIRFTVDSGAAETMCKKTDAKDFPIIHGGNESMTKYIMPNGEIVENDGEKHLKVKTAEGDKFMVRTQLIDVRKPLMSVSKVCDEGNRVIFEENGGFIENTKSGQRTNFQREGNVYVLELDLVSGFTGQA